MTCYLGQPGTLSPGKPLKKKKKKNHLLGISIALVLRSYLWKGNKTKQNKTKQVYLNIPTTVPKILGNAQPMFLNHFPIIIPPKGAF